MAAVANSVLSKSEHDELCCTYAALALFDDGVTVSADKLNTLIKASKNTVEPYWPGLFARMLEGKNIGDLLMNAGSSGAAPAAAPTGGAAPAPAAEAKKEAKKEEKEEEDADMGFSLFD
eukprot:GILJ01000138.1.p1 GENE.GILJ01000138.1~~GILJ01000138.1.p1  ORF type:complete len:119 (+),score=40.38 GILJ01000138.1:82-438(+)